MIAAPHPVAIENHRLEIPAAVLAAAAGHGERTYPEECCGLLLGRPLPDGAGSAVVRAMAAENEHGEERHRRYTIAPEAVLHADRAARAEGLEIVGYYHSHPDHPAAPSAFDREHAWPEVSYLIVPVENGCAGSPRSWRLDGERGGFDEETVAVTGDSTETEPER